jgi:hypothetical protein
MSRAIATRKSSKEPAERVGGLFFPLRLGGNPSIWPQFAGNMETVEMWLDFFKEVSKDSLVRSEISIVLSHLSH